MFANWAIHVYRNGVLDPEFLVYGQSVVVSGGPRAPVRTPDPVIGENSITLERTAYWLQIDSSGAVYFREGPPSNRREVRTSTISANQHRDLVAGFAAIHFFELNDIYPETSTDGPEAYIELKLDGKTKRIKYFNAAPPGLDELSRTIERTTNIHHWLHDDPQRFSLQSPVAGPYSRGGEDLKQENYVREDAFARIKPGMTPLMQVAGGGGIQAEIDAARRVQRASQIDNTRLNVAQRERSTQIDYARLRVGALQRALQRGDDVNAADETGWTALMIAAVTGQPQSISVLLGAGARIDQRDNHGDTALIGAAAVRFGDLHMAAETVKILLARGASPDAVDDLDESALMWAARAGNPESIKLLLDAGANPARLDQAGHDALFYLRKARADLTFDPATVQRYDQAESLLGQAMLKRR